MTDPTDEMQPHRNAGEPAAASAGAPDTAPTSKPATVPASEAAGAPGSNPATAPVTGNPDRPRSDRDATDGRPQRQSDSNRPADSGWREPPWFPPRSRDRDRRPSAIALIVGVILIAIGLYYFFDRTLGVALPRIQWGSLWPVLLIVLGVVILVRSIQRKA
ncbi:MAG: hypothetical protein H0V73_01140 [Chloroflexi bacterium]|nr:hypothetical protein [Chloroflexota bacterium]